MVFRDRSRNNAISQTELFQTTLVAKSCYLLLGRAKAGYGRALGPTFVIISPVLQKRFYRKNILKRLF